MKNALAKLTALALAAALASPSPATAGCAVEVSPAGAASPVIQSESFGYAATQYFCRDYGVDSNRYTMVSASFSYTQKWHDADGSHTTNYTGEADAMEGEAETGEDYLTFSNPKLTIVCKPIIYDLCVYSSPATNTSITTIGDLMSGIVEGDNVAYFYKKYDETVHWTMRAHPPKGKVFTGWTANEHNPADAPAAPDTAYAEMSYGGINSYLRYTANFRNRATGEWPDGSSGGSKHTAKKRDGDPNPPSPDDDDTSYLFVTTAWTPSDATGSALPSEEWYCGKVGDTLSVTVAFGSPRTSRRFIEWVDDNGERVTTNRSFETTLTFPAAGETEYHTYTAIFCTTNYYNVRTHGRGNIGGYIDGAGEYAEGATATLTAYPKGTGAAFIRWKGYPPNLAASVLSYANPYEFTVTGDAVIYGVFHRNTDSILRDANGNIYRTAAGAVVRDAIE